MDTHNLLALLQSRLDNLLAVYVFGSRASGEHRPDSDLDMAVLVAGKVDVLLLWELSGALAELAQCPVDLLDLRAASTVMQYQVITRGSCIWAADMQAGLYECFILGEKLHLDEARGALLEQIQQEGRIYAR